MIRTFVMFSAALGLIASSAAAPAIALSTSSVRQTTGSGAVTKSKTVTRTHLSAGKQKVVDKRTLSLSVDTTTALRDRQGIEISWSGAHPTGGVVSDQNSPTAASVQEYPMVLMQCRGVDSKNVPPDKRISPETCWTQTPSERFTNDYNSAAPPWRLDQFAPKSERAQYTKAPKQRPPGCFGGSLSERWVPFVAASGKTYLGGPGGCAGTAPEATELSSLSVPSNTTYAITAPNGRGSATFNVRSGASNASLGCSDKVPCALVAIPVMGISCDADAKGLPASDRPTGTELDAARERCEAKGNYAPGQLAQQSTESAQAVTGSMWWSASNWRNRMSVPLNFAPLETACDITQSAGVSSFGSELMIQATAQWAPVFCGDSSKTPVQHVQTGEPQARNTLKVGDIDSALVSQPADGLGYTRPVVNAPIAMSGFAVTYAIDGANGRLVTNLRLTPRLLAKLLTSSYPSIVAVKDGYKALSSNPLNITDDPEFQALNPDVKQGMTTQAAATLLSLSSDSDVIHSLTSYINADPEARAWLDGKTDPWGMKVNPNYKGISLPVDSWPTLDTYQPTSIYTVGVNPCLAMNPVPYLPLVSAPLTRMSYIALAMQFSIAQSQVVCSLPAADGSTDGAKLVPLGRQVPGFRFMMGITSLPDAERYKIAEAALQTHVDNPAEKVSGRTFVKPSDASLRVTATYLKADTSSDAWTVPYATLASNKGASGAYPGAMVVYDAVATQDLAKSDAVAYADWLRYVVTDGQQPGATEGHLPKGYLPLTEANGLGGLAKYSLQAADCIQDQKGCVPQVSKKQGPNDPPGGPNPPPGDNPQTPPGDPTPEDPGPIPKGAPPFDTVPLGTTVSSAVGPAGVIVPAVLVLAVVIGLVAGFTLLRGRLRREP